MRVFACFPVEDEVHEVALVGVGLSILEIEVPVSESKFVENILKRVDKPGYAASDHLTIVKRALPAASSIQVKAVITRLNEGGIKP